MNGSFDRSFRFFMQKILMKMAFSLSKLHIIYFDKKYEFNLCLTLRCYFWALCKVIVQDLYLIFDFVQFGCNKKKNEGILEKDLFDIFRWFMKGMCQKNQSYRENMLGFLPQLKAKIKYILNVVQALYLSG